MGRTSDRFKETIIRVGLKSGQLCQEYERVGMYQIWRLVEGYQHLDLVSWEIWLIYEEDNPRRMIKIKEWYELIPPSWYQGGSRSPSWQGMGLWEAEDEGRGMLVRYLRQETPLKEQGQHGTGKYSFVVFSDHFTGQARYFIFVGMRSLSATTIPDKFLCSTRIGFLGASWMLSHSLMSSLWCHPWTPSAIPVCLLLVVRVGPVGVGGQRLLGTTD